MRTSPSRFASFIFTAIFLTMALDAKILGVITLQSFAVDRFTRSVWVKIKSSCDCQREALSKKSMMSIPLDLSPSMLGPSNDPDPYPEFIWTDQMTFDFERMDVYQLSLTDWKSSKDRQS